MSKEPKKKELNLFIFFPVFLVFLYFFLKLFVFDSSLFSIYSSVSNRMNFTIGFILLSLIFVSIFLLAYYAYVKFKKRSDGKTYEKKSLHLNENMLWIVLFLGFVSAMIFYMKDIISGRYSIVHLFLRDVFSYGFSYPDVRTYLSLPVSILNSMGFSINVGDLIVFNMFLGIALGLTFFIFLYKISNDMTPALFFSTAFVLSVQFISNAISFESLLGSVFFTLISFFCMFLFFREKNESYKTILYFIFLSFAVASVFFRYEKSVLLLIPLSFFIVLNWDHFSKYKRTNVIFLIIFCLVSIPIMVYYFSAGNDYSLKGEGYEKSIFEIVSNSITILKNNLFQRQDFLLWKFNVSIFFYIALVASAFIIYDICKSKKFNSNDKVFTLFAFYWIFYTLSQLAFKSESLVPSWKNLDIYFAELFLSYYLFDKIAILFSAGIKDEARMKKLFFSGLLIFSLLLSLFFSRYFFFSGKNDGFPEDVHTGEMRLLVSEDLLGKYDRSCYVIRFNDRYPLFDYYLGGFKAFDVNIIDSGKYNLSGKCFYLYKGYFSETELKYERIISNMTPFLASFHNSSCIISSRDYHYRYHQENLTIKLYNIRC